MGLYSRRKFDNGAELAVWEITESEDELREICAPVPNNEIEELMILKSEARRKEKLAVRALINELFPEKLYLGHHDNGRPYLQNCLTEISISHCSDFAVVLVHPEESVGIDIERLDRDFTAVEKKALSEEEIDDLSDDSDDHKRQLAIYWCAKEAIYKRMSKNGVDFAEQIELDKFNLHDEGSLDATFIDKDGEEEEFELNYEVFDNHVMVWLVG